MAASWSGSWTDPTDYKVAARGSRPTAGSPRMVSAQSRSQARQKNPRRGGMPGPMNGPGRTMMRDSMRQESSTHASHQDRLKGSDVAQGGLGRHGTGPCELS